MSYGEILLDVDCDFMLDGDYGWEDGNTHYEAHLRPRGVIELDPQISVPGRELGRELKYFKRRNNATQVYLIIDHHEALYWWDTLVVERALCIHIDAHHDLWRNDIPMKSKAHNPVNRTYIDCGNYLQQAVREKMIRRALYVPSPFRHVWKERKEIQKKLPKKLHKRVALLSWEAFLRRKEKYPQADIITIAVSPEWFPRKYWGEIIDLCDQLGIPPKIIDRIGVEADQKWDELELHGETSSFVFPYDGVQYI